jgi:hypothetical protein
MNETMSLLLATTILAMGGFGLYMYKNPEEAQKGGEEYNEDSLFGGGSFWSSNKEEDVEEDLDLDFDDYEPKPRTRANKTKRNKRSNGSSKRRY